jgi:hypothetical protein
MVSAIGLGMATTSGEFARLVGVVEISGLR